MENSKIKQLEYWHKISLNIGALLLVDLITPGVIKMWFGVEIGIFSGLIYIFLKLILGSGIAGSIVTTIMFFDVFFFIPFGISSILKRKINKIKKLNEKVVTVSN